MLIKALIDKKRENYTRCSKIDEETNREIHNVYYTSENIEADSHVNKFSSFVNANRVIKMYYQVQPKNSKDRVTMYDLAYVRPRPVNIIFEKNIQQNNFDILMLTGKHAGDVYQGVYVKRMSNEGIGHDYWGRCPDGRFRFLFNEYYSEEIGYHIGDVRAESLLNDENGNPQTCPRYTLTRLLVNKWKRDNSFGFISQLIANKQAEKKAEKLAEQKQKAKQEEKMFAKHRDIEDALFDTGNI